MELVRVVEEGRVMLLYCQVTIGRGLPTAVQVKVTLAPSPVSFTETIGVAVGVFASMDVWMCGCVDVCMCDICMRVHCDSMHV